MRILIPTLDYPPIEGGIATLSLQLSRELAALGHDVTVVAPHFEGMEAFDAREPVRVLRFRGYGLGWPRLLPFVRTARPLLRDADLVLAMNIGYGGLLARFRGARYVVFAYAYEFLKFRSSPVMRALYRGIYARAAAVVAISGFTRANLIAFGVPADAIATVLPGAPLVRPVEDSEIAALRARLGLEDARLILAVGRFIPRKGHLTLVQALPAILELCPNTRLVMAGRGPERDACIAKAKQLGLEGLVVCPGYVDDGDLAALYAACEVFALPAGEDEDGQVEGFGLVFSEAHAYGKPVVAGRSGGVPDAVIDGETGLLVPPNNPAALAEAVARVLNDPAFARRLGERGRQRVEEELNWRNFALGVLSAAGCPS